MFRLLTYLQYLIRARGPHSAHSPFIYALFEEVLNDEKWYYGFDEIEKQRLILLNDSTAFTPQDYGAGSKTLSPQERTIQQVARTSLKRAKYGRLLFRLIHHLKYEKVLELGTSLGVTTCYLGMAGSKVTTVEGDPTIASKARETIEKIGLSSVEIVNEPFDPFLEKLSPNEKYDLIFIDGNHTGKALLRYFEMLLPRLNPCGCFVMDDIHWSKDMLAAWQEIKQSDRFPFKLDLFELGLLIDHPNSEVQEHSLRY